MVAARLSRAPVRVADGDDVSDETTCRCGREPAWCFVHRRWGRMMSSHPTRMELVEQARGLTMTATTQADEITRLRRELAAAHEIIAGRETPPTDAELAALRRVCGSCSLSVFYGDGSRRVLRSEREGHALMLREAAFVTARGWLAVWRAFDVSGCPCAWPVVASEAP